MNKKRDKKNKLRSYYDRIGTLNLKTELVAAIAIAIVTVVVKSFIDLLGFVYWYSFFRRYSIPLRYIKDAVSFNSNANAFTLLLLPIIGMIINLYALIKWLLIWLTDNAKPGWLSTRPRNQRRSRFYFIIQFIFRELLLIILFPITIVCVIELVMSLENVFNFYIDDSGVMTLVLFSLIYFLIRKDIVRPLYLRRKIKEMSFKRKIDTLAFLSVTGFFCMIIIVVFFGSIIHGVFPNERGTTLTYRFFIEPGLVDGERDEKNQYYLKEPYHGTLDLILFETKDYYYTIKTKIETYHYDFDEVTLEGYDVGSYSLRGKQNVSLKKCFVIGNLVPHASSLQARVLFFVSLYYVLFAISALYNFLDCITDS